MCVYTTAQAHAKELWQVLKCSILNKADLKLQSIVCFYFVRFGMDSAPKRIDS